jgi:hypothetical protein
VVATKITVVIVSTALLFFYRAWQEDGYFLCQTELCVAVIHTCCELLLDSLHFDLINWNTTAKEKYRSPLRNLPAGDKVVRSWKQLFGHWRSTCVSRMTIWKVVCHDVRCSRPFAHYHSRDGIVHHDTVTRRPTFFRRACTLWCHHASVRLEIPEWLVSYVGSSPLEMAKKATPSTVHAPGIVCCLRGRGISELRYLQPRCDDFVRAARH